MNIKSIFWGTFILTVVGFCAMFARSAWLARSLPHLPDTPQLVVLAYDSFASPLGAGPSLLQKFEEACGCKVQLITGGDAGFLLEKLKMAKAQLKVDVVLGLDQLLLGAARKEQVWKSLSTEHIVWENGVQSRVHSDFVPFDWAPMTFIYRKSEINPPTTPSDLADARFQKSIALQDPRTSSPGLQFLHALPTWLNGQGLDNFLPRLKNNIHSISPSWSASYGLFQRKQAKLVFSYLTSLIYHWTVEKSEDYQAVSFDEGHPVQVEYVAVPADCAQCELAENFVNYLLQNQSQRLLMEKNFMFPAVEGIIKGSVFEDLPKLQLFKQESAETIEAERPGLLETWQNSMK